MANECADNVLELIWSKCSLARKQWPCTKMFDWNDQTI